MVPLENEVAALNTRSEGPGRLAPLVGALSGKLGKRLGFVCAVVVPWFCYLRTLCPTVYGVDSAELTAAAATLGIAHPTGYPTFILIGHAFSLLPFGDVGFRLNLMSAVFAGLTSGAVFLITHRLTGGTVASLVAALSLASSYFFWAVSVAAEVYTLHAFFAALLVSLLLAEDPEARRKGLPPVAFTLGLALGNHLSTILAAPALAILALGANARRLLRPGTILASASGLLLGLSVYLYLPLAYLHGAGPHSAGVYDASGHFVPMDLTRFESFRWLVTAEAFRPFLVTYSPDRLIEQIGSSLGSIWGNFLGVGMPIAILGLVTQMRENPRVGLALAAIALGNLVFFASYAAPDKQLMFAAGYVPWAIWIGVGAREIQALARSVLAVRHAELGSRLGGFLLLSLPLAALVVNYPLVDLSHDRTARERGESILAAVDHGSVVVVTWWVDVGLLGYLQRVEAMRPDVRVVNRSQIGTRDLQALVDSEITRTSIFWVDGVPNWESDLPLGYEHPPVPANQAVHHIQRVEPT